MGEDAVFPKQDVRAAVINSMFFGGRNCLDSTDFMPAIEQSYKQFMKLKLFLPGVFDAVEFDNQFKYYNKIIYSLNQITGHL